MTVNGPEPLHSKRVLVLGRSTRCPQVHLLILLIQLIKAFFIPVRNARIRAKKPSFSSPAITSTRTAFNATSVTLL
jgi:hypothetical protein